MNNWKISLRNLLHKPLYAFLAIFSLAISIGLLLCVQQLDASVKNQFENGLGKVDMVIGAKGSPLQLVLSSVLHIDNPTGNIPYAQANKLAKNPMVKSVVPISYGDNFKGYRIVGSSKDYGSLFDAEILEGREAKTSMEAVLGYEVAQKLNLKLGDTFVSSHGLTENTIEEHDQEFTVVGIFKPTYKVIDRLIMTPLESIWEVHSHGHEKNDDQGESHIHEEHDHEGHNYFEHDEEGHHHDEHHGDKIEKPDGHVPVDKNENLDKEVTSLLVSFRNPMGYIAMSRNINENTEMQAALPKFELDRLFKFTGVGVKVVSWIAYIILLISCLTIFIALYKMVRERAFDLALMRTYGASNLQLFGIITFEGLLMVLISIFFGFVFSQLGLQLIIGIFKVQFQQEIQLTFPTMQMVRTLVIVFVTSILSIFMAIVPLLHMNISKIISDEK
ncbi:ABC transporter permease [Cytophaga sp. FL35]|uniref:ABC transporter permease n=1 Tax=Cytophaga sp. FL35 TaxID=1904456 RepID=UPI001653C2AF|nr:ABC transporter permease [Cytophaga sp. FL35]MBC6997006.1 ABC transporter permease [Cytophaga sp. FL35]